MVFPVLRMDANRRMHYAISTLCLLSLCIVLAIGAAVHTLSLSVILSDSVAEVMHHRSIAGYVPFLNTPIFIVVAALHFWAAHLISASRRRVEICQIPLISNPIAMLMLALSCTLVVATCSMYYYTMFKEAISYGILHGMKHYRSQSADKDLLDRIQVQFKCCAITGYQDWLNDNKTNSPLLTRLSEFAWAPQHWSGCSQESCYLPPTCCRLNQLKCSVQITVRKNIISQEIGDTRIGEWMHDQGCVENVMDAVHSLSIITVPVLLLSLQLLALTVSQISVTANFVVRQFDETVLDQDTPLPAWILPFPGISCADLMQKCKKRIAENRHFDEKTYLDMTAMSRMSTMSGVDPTKDMSKVDASRIKETA